MTRKRRTPPELVPTPVEATPEVQRRAALVVASHATDPDDARHLLDMLGLPTGHPNR